MPAVATAGGLPTRLGKYEILTPLATGGMARIYVARTTGIGSFERHVVIKMITPERANDTIAVQMFLDEARLAASLNHQNVAQVFEVGEDGGIHYLAMEYVHGQDLRALLAKAGSQGTRVPLELALTVVAGAAAGLHHAHERRDANGVPLGIVHRDVSPSNIMIGLDGAVKLLDFGIAKAAARSVETQSGVIKGKFAYMSPEQCRGRDVDRRSDVFSLGIILYEITTQHRCFRADSDFDTMHRIVTGDVVRPTRLVQGYPQALEAIVMKALAIDANQRYQSAGMLLEAIEAFSVSSRMSLSTMALGRFMREMFGEVPEPWLAPAARGSSSELLEAVQRRESTISSTAGVAAGSHEGLRAPTNLEPEIEAEPMAGRTLLDLPPGDDTLHEDPEHASWNAKSFPAMEPAYASTQTLPPADPKPSRISNPNLVALSIAPTAQGIGPVGSAPPADELQTERVELDPPEVRPAAAFATTGSTSGAAHPGSGSGPKYQPKPGALPATRNGYASGAAASMNDASHGRLAIPAADPDVAVRPNRRPLVIGLGLVLVGLGVFAFVGLQGGEVSSPSSLDGSATPRGSAAVIAPDPSPIQVAEPVKVGAPADAQVVTDEETSISIKVVSDPDQANVLLAGKPIGTTPLETKIPRGEGAAMLTVQKSGYDEVHTKIDLTADFTKDVTLVKVEEPKPDKKPDRRPIVRRPPERRPPGNNQASTKPADPKPAKPACQPPNAVDPFDPRPVCK